MTTARAQRASAAHDLDSSGRQLRMIGRRLERAAGEVLRVRRCSISSCRDHSWLEGGLDSWAVWVLELDLARVWKGDWNDGEERVHVVLSRWW
ncbi:hypothetical protein Drorol1_Dr00006606 [Drosera rotundifolia]